MNTLRIALILVLIFVGSLTISTVLALGITASIGSGSYDHAIRVELSATAPDAKIFYTFRPDGTPDDILAYTGAITVTRTTPLMYFAMRSPTDETKIIESRYTIAYPADIRIETVKKTDTDTVTVTLRNTASQDHILSLWRIVSVSGIVTIPWDTRINAGGTYTITGYHYGTGVIVLQSPDSEERGIFSPESITPVISPPSESDSTETPPPSITPTPLVSDSFSGTLPMPIATGSTTLTDVSIATGSIAFSGQSTSDTGIIASITPPIIPEPSSTEPPMADTLKTSVADSPNTRNNGIFWVFLVLAVGGGIVLRVVATR